MSISDKPFYKKKIFGFLLFVVLVGLGHLIMLYPVSLGNDLRLQVAERNIQKGWHKGYEVIPMLQAGYARVEKNEKLGAKDLNQIWQEMEKYHGGYPEFFWLGLSYIEAKSGRMEYARKALKKAKAIDPTIVNLARGVSWDSIRKPLGL